LRKKQKKQFKELISELDEMLGNKMTNCNNNSTRSAQPESNQMWNSGRRGYPPASCGELPKRKTGWTVKNPQQVSRTDFLLLLFLKKNCSEVAQVADETFTFDRLFNFFSKANLLQQKYPPEIFCLPFCMDPSDGRHTIIDVREYFVCV
jgi:hypothetical protein